jgi:hypothetical protein
MTSTPSPSPTYYPPSVTSSTTTFWLPMVSTHNFQGTGDNRYCLLDGTASMSTTWAFIPNYGACYWPTRVLPAQVSQVVALNTETSGPTRFGIAPFAGCPQSWSPAMTLNATMTMCCPPRYTSYGMSGLDLVSLDCHE